MVTLLVTLVTANPQTALISHVAFRIFVVGERRDFKFDSPADYSKSQPADDKPFPKGAWSWSRDPFKFWEIMDIFRKWCKIET